METFRPFSCSQLTELFSTTFVLHLANKDNYVTSRKVLCIVGVSLLHIIAGSVDQFIQNVFLGEGERKLKEKKGLLTKCTWNRIFASNYSRHGIYASGSFPLGRSTRSSPARDTHKPTAAPRQNHSQRHRDNVRTRRHHVRFRFNAVSSKYFKLLFAISQSRAISRCFVQFSVILVGVEIKTSSETIISIMQGSHN